MFWDYTYSEGCFLAATPSVSTSPLPRQSKGETMGDKEKYMKCRHNAKECKDEDKKQGEIEARVTRSWERTGKEAKVKYKGNIQGGYSTWQGGDLSAVLRLLLRS